MKAKFKGPIIQRRDQVDAGTADQRLLDSRGPSDWVHTDPWRVLRIQAEFVEGFGALTELGPAVAVFGSARLGAEHPSYAPSPLWIDDAYEQAHHTAIGKSISRGRNRISRPASNSSTPSSTPALVAETFEYSGNPLILNVAIGRNIHPIRNAASTARRGRSVANSTRISGIQPNSAMGTVTNMR